MSYAPWSWRSWIVAALIALIAVALQSWLTPAYPAWVRWICIAIPFAVGGAVLVSPGLAGMKNLTLARVVGAVFVAAAVFGVYSQLTDTIPE